MKVLRLLRCSLIALEIHTGSIVSVFFFFFFSAKYQRHMFTAKEPDKIMGIEVSDRMCFRMFQPDVNKAPSPLNEKGCCSTRCENKCCTDIFKKEKKSVFMMLIYEKSERRKEGDGVIVASF